MCPLEWKWWPAAGARAEQHIGHEEHLCDLVAKRKMAQVARLAKGAKYVCHICGRAAAKSTNLCEPVEI
jgi:hypothetical protein